MFDRHEMRLNAATDRRDFLKASGLVVGCAALAAAIPAQAARIEMPDAGAFDIAFANQHTGERFSGTYRVGSKYLPDAFEEINYVLRDFRNDEVFPIDPRALDIMYMVRSKLDANKPLEILSGYRSPKTNSMLRASSEGVAKNSLHMSGQAIDMRLPGHSTKHLRNIATSLRAGGVGYYPGSDFVHIDTGRVRHW